MLVFRSFVNFNSIKVRLELSGSVPSTTMSNSFQFHKGAIRTVLEVLYDVAFLYFNSIKVRLEPTGNTDEVDKLTFQFHKGAIRTDILYRLHSPLCYFNSIKVRLER